MKQRVNKTYKPAELTAAIAALQNNAYLCFNEADAHGIIIALHTLGYRIVHTEEPEL